MRFVRRASRGWTPQQGTYQSVRKTAWAGPSWESVLTELFQPPIVLSAMFLFLPAAQSGSMMDAVFGLVPVVLVCLGPLLVVVCLARQGRLSGHHVANRKQRAPIMASTFVLSIAAVFILRSVHAPEPLVAFVLAVMAGMAALVLVSPWWKISGHAMTLAGSVAVLVAVAGWAWVSAVLLLPCVGAARVRLGAHTPRQVIVGSVAGALLIGGAFQLMRT